MNIFLFELCNDSTKTIRLLALDFYAVIVDSGFALINYPDWALISDHRKMLYVFNQVNIKKFFYGFFWRCVILKNSAKYFTTMQEAQSYIWCGNGSAKSEAIKALGVSVLCAINIGWR